MDLYDKRSYQRGEHFYIDARVSRDQIRWRKAIINNLSSGGLQLMTDESFAVGDKLWFDLTIQGFFSEFDMKVNGEIRNEKKIDGKNAYGVVFLNLSHDKKILIDENIKNDRPVGGAPYNYDN